MSLRAGLLDMSNAWSTLGKKCCILAESQKVLHTLCMYLSLFHSSAVPIPFHCRPYSIPLSSLFHSTAVSIPFHCRLYSIPLPSLFQELAQLVPDVNTPTQDLPTYTGNRESTRILQTTKSQLDHMDPPSYGSGLGTPAFDDNWQHNDRSL